MVPSPPSSLVEFPEKLQCLFSPKRYMVLYGGRGAGRSWGIARSLLIEGTSKHLDVLCARELQNSIDESVHKTLSSQVSKLGLSNLYEVQRDRIIGPFGTNFSFVGIKNNTNKVRSYEGIDVCWVEEANKVSKNSWNILIPTIRKKGSRLIITFNPELESDYTFQHFVQERKKGAREVKNGSGEVLWLETDDTIICKMTYRDNPWFFTDTELAGDMKKTRELDHDAYLNVWGGFPSQVLEGAVYAKELRAAQASGHICQVPYEREIPVDTFWDLGRADNTAIWFMQRVGMQYRVLAYYENSGFEITHFLKECQRRGYVYGEMFLPHDGAAQRLGTKHSIQEIMQNAGYRVRIVPRLSPTDGINAAREMFPNCWFDEDQCADGLHALRHYRYKVVDGQRSNIPLHDSASDGADAFRYMAVARKLPRARVDMVLKLKRRVSRFAETLPTLGWMQ